MRLTFFVLSANIPWDFDHSELEIEIVILCLNPMCRKSGIRNLEEVMQLLADACECYFEQANLAKCSAT